MSHEQAPDNAQPWEWVIAHLTRRDAGSGEALGDEDESTIRSIEAQLDTLAADLRKPPPEDDFAEESGCERAIELVERIGVRGAGAAAGGNELRQIGPYEVIARLRQGGMGTVFKAVHSRLQRIVAVKILPAFRAHDAGAVARFRREMLAVGNLQHRHIVAATDAGEVDGMHYLVMEYVDGLDLSTLMRRVGPLAPANACEIISQAAEGVEEAHRRGIIHRDIKPSNLILVEDGEGGAIVKVLDFGLARLAEEFADDELTTSGQIMGTLKYMAPEQCSNSRNVDARADVYSLGATLYRLLSGQAPFSGARFESPPALVAALAGETPERLRSLRGDLPAELTAIVECMMAKDPAQRYATPGEAIESLAPWTKGADLAGLLARARAAETALPPPRLFREPRPVIGEAGRAESKLVARRHLPLWMPLLLGVAALVVLAYLVAPRSDSAPPAQEARGRAAASISSRTANSAARSREVVEWLVQQRPAEATIASAGPEYATLKTGDAVPSDPFELVTAILTDNKTVKDKDLARFDELSQFTTLSLARTAIGDAGLKRLGELPALEILFLAETKVGNAGVESLKRFPRLKVLQLYGTGVTNTGVERIAESHKQLGELSLVGCKVDDRGIEYLESLKSLKLLALDRTGVTVVGVARLQIALPNCEIRSDFSADEVAAAMDRERAGSRSIEP